MSSILKCVRNLIFLNGRGLKLTRPEREFTDKDIKNHIDNLAQRFSDLVPVDEPVKADDFVVCNVTSSHDGKVVASSEEESIQVRSTLSLSDATIEKFDKLMIGAKADDKKTVSVEISEFADNEELRGRTADLEFEVLDVKRVEAKDSDEVATLLGLESQEELEEIVRKSMEDRLQYSQREEIRSQISKILTESADWELPPDLLKRQSGRELDRAVMEMRSSGFSEPEIIARQNTLRKNILEKTEMLLKEHFILERVAEEETIEDEPHDYDLEIARIAAQQNDSPRRIRARLERDGQMDSLRNMIIEQKVINLITDNAEFKSTEYKVDEKPDTVALDFFAGGSSAYIPEAKYDGAEAEPIPGMKPERE